MMMRDAFLIDDWAASVMDVVEPVPLDHGAIRAVADVGVVMTMDFRRDAVVEGRAMQAARVVWPAALRAAPRVPERLSIRRRRWVRSVGAERDLGAERDRPTVLVQNVTSPAGPWARDDWRSGDADRVAALCRRSGMGGGAAIGLIRRLVSARRGPDAGRLTCLSRSSIRLGRRAAPIVSRIARRVSG